jgi:hypothetical protein
MDSSGNMTILGNLTSAIGNISLTSGNISTARGSVSAYRDYLSSHPAWRIGASSILGATTAYSSTTPMGCYTVCGSWSTLNASSHTIPSSYFLQHPVVANASGSFTIYVSDKANSGTKQGVLRGDYLLVSGTATFYTISTTKTAGLTTFSVATSGTALVVSTDTNCRMCWRFDGCL